MARLSTDIDTDTASGVRHALRAILLQTDVLGDMLRSGEVVVSATASTDGVLAQIRLRSLRCNLNVRVQSATDLRQREDLRANVVDLDHPFEAGAFDFPDFLSAYHYALMVYGDRL